jgi:hypothetical protein
MGAVRGQKNMHQALSTPKSFNSHNTSRHLVFLSPILQMRNSDQGHTPRKELVKLELKPRAVIIQVSSY